MGTLLVFALKSSACLIIFYLFYRLLNINKETFYRYNRIVLLAMVVFSWLLSYTIQPEKAEAGFYAPVSPELFELSLNATPLNASTEHFQANYLIPTVVLIYLAGVILSALLYLSNLFNLLSIIHKGEKVKMENGTTLIKHPGKIAPFSWLNYIVIAATDFPEDNKEVILHETAHFYNKHSYDLILIHICQILMWFNPVIWYIRKELQDIHEFEADAFVLRQGVDIRKYQLLLIEKAAGIRLFPITNNFNHSKLKKRITMMTRKRSIPQAKFKYLYVLPLTAIVVTVFARSEATPLEKEITGFSISEVYTINGTDQEKSTIAATDTTEATQLKIRGVDISNPPLYIVNNKKVPADIFNAIDPNSIESISVLTDKSSLEIYGDEGKNGVIILTLKEREEKDKPVIEIRPVNTEDNPLNDKNIVFFVNGKVYTDGIQNIDPESILDISVIKDSQNPEFKHYFDQGKTGVILIQTK